MHIKNRNAKGFYCVTSYASSQALQLLGFFLEDFGGHYWINEIERIINDPLETGLTGDCTSLNKQSNGKVYISFLYGEGKSFFEIDGELLIKTMKLYCKARDAAPKEVIIKFDEHYKKVFVESIPFKDFDE